MEPEKSSPGPVRKTSQRGSNRNADHSENAFEDQTENTLKDQTENNCEDQTANTFENQTENNCEDGELCVCEGTRTQPNSDQPLVGGATQQDDSSLLNHADGNTRQLSPRRPRIRWHDRLVMIRQRAEWDEWESSLHDYPGQPSAGSKGDIVGGGRSKGVVKCGSVGSKRGRKRKSNQDIAEVASKRSSMSFDPNLCVDACDEPTVRTTRSRSMEGSSYICNESSVCTTRSRTPKDSSYDWSSPERKVRARKRNIPKTNSKRKGKDCVKGDKGTNKTSSRPRKKKDFIPKQSTTTPKKTNAVGGSRSKGAVSSNRSKDAVGSSRGKGGISGNRGKCAVGGGKGRGTVSGSKGRKCQDRSESKIDLESGLSTDGLGMKRKYSFLKDTKLNCVIKKDDRRLKLSKRGVDRQNKLNEKTRRLTDFVLSDTCKNHLHQIFLGKVRSELHDTYTKGTAKERRSMAHSGFGPINDEQQVDKIWLKLCQCLEDWIPKDNPHMGQYAMDVLVPEAIAFGLRKVKGYSKAKAWEMFDKGVRNTVEELRILHYELIASSQSQRTKAASQSKVDNSSYPEELPDIPVCS